jgi:hypothetical protein
MSTTGTLSSQEATLHDYLSELFDAFNAAKSRVNTLAARRGATEVMIRLPLTLDVIFDLFAELNRQIGLTGLEWESLATHRLGGLEGRGVELLDLARRTLDDIGRERHAGYIEGLLEELEVQLREACLIYLGYDRGYAEDPEISRDDIAAWLVAQSMVPIG